MTPTVQPAAAGTQENLDAGWTPVRRPRLITVIRPENRRSNRRTGSIARTGTAQVRITCDRAGVLLAWGLCPVLQRTALASRNANCRLFRPSRTGPACGPRYSADAVTSPASAVMKAGGPRQDHGAGYRSGSSDDRSDLHALPLSLPPLSLYFTPPRARARGAALINMTAARVIHFHAGMSASSRTCGVASSGVSVGSVMPAGLSGATVPAYVRDSKWSPHSHQLATTGATVRSPVSSDTGSVLQHWRCRRRKR